MIELFEKSMNTLELPRVLDMLAGEAVTDEGKELCRAARPSDDPAEVHRLQSQTSAAFDMLVKRGTPSFSGVRPVAAALQRADRGGSLNTRELLDIAGELDGKYGAKTAASLVREAAEVYEKRGRLKKF